jgi:hypothetical protein
MKSIRLALAMVLTAGVAPTALAVGGQGMTWSATYGHANGVDHVGCAGCDAYLGDTSCKQVLPILCLIQDGSPVPPGITPDFYNGWAQGNIATTFPVAGTALTSQAVADQICAASFGTGWRMAEHHDGGGGWTWYAYGHVRQDMRLWVHINNQPANCWNP